MFAVEASSCSSSSRFDPSSTPNTVTPVRLPPGRLRLVTSPTSTGSNPIMKTIGIVVVVAFAAGAEGLPIAAITNMMADQIGRQCWQSIVLVICPAVFDRDVLALDIASLFQTPTERGQEMWVRAGD